MKINLLVELYDPTNIERSHEIFEALEKNLTNPFITSIFAFIEADCTFKKLKHEKINFIIINQRATFLYMYNFIKNYLNDVNNINNTNESYNIIANADISFDESLVNIKKVNLKEKEIIALTRYEYHTNKGEWLLYTDYPGKSHDCWIFKGDIKEIPQNINFPLGKLGCDCRMIAEFYKLGYRIYNFCHEIKIYHHHQSNFRTYSERERIPYPYLHCFPSKISDKEQWENFLGKRYLNQIGFF